MALNVGSTTIQDVKLGIETIQAIYIGNVEIWVNPNP